MKQPRKLTRNEKELLTKRGFSDATKYAYIEEDQDAIRVIHKPTKETLWIAKRGI